MPFSVLRRALAAALVAGAAVMAAPGPAAAWSGGGCTGPAGRQACVTVVTGDGGHPEVRFEARADLTADAGRDCRLRLVSFDDTTRWRWDYALMPCGKPQEMKWTLPNPTFGHAYRAELQILPNGRNYEFAEFVQSPSLTF
ncbi:hypothetical protein [Streptomyces sp. NPDC007369]|uniref:hypothetical protein n=1 Tax=Streptomyces sp. NPDC007369 TaxID=3154589 RepID=UPI003409E31F